MVEVGNNFEKSVRILRSGGIIVVPSDTVFIPACRIDKPDTIKRLYKIKERPKSQPTLVLVNSVAMAKKYINVTKAAEQLIKKFWPGPLTIIFPAKNSATKEIQGKGKTLGIRYPNYSFILNIIKKVGVPILAPSANFKGKPPPKKFKDLDEEFIKKVDYVFRGRCKIGKESTVVDATVNPLKVIREGAVKLNL